MSVLDNQSRVNGADSLFAPAGSSGGGGGGVSPDLTLSTLVIAQSLEMDNNITSPQSVFRITGIDVSTFRIGLVGSLQPHIDILGGSNRSVTIQNADFIVSSINGAAPGGGGGSPNGQFSTLAVSSCMLVNPGSFNYAPANDGTVGAPVFGVTIESSDGNSLYTREIANGSGLLDNFKGISSSTATAGLRTLVNSSFAYVGYPSSYLANDGGQTNYAFSTLRQIAPSTISLEAPLVSVSTLTVSSIITPSFVPGSNVVTSWLQSPGNQITIQQSNALGANAVFGWPNATQVNMGMIAANATDGMSFICDNGFAYISGGGGHFSLSNVSSINGNAPALTSYSQQDVGALFSTLFAANPGLSTIVY